LLLLLLLLRLLAWRAEEAIAALSLLARAAALCVLATAVKEVWLAESMSFTDAVLPWPHAGAPASTTSARVITAMTTVTRAEDTNRAREDIVPIRE
jgi:hypothetical protein